jgi:hypothetical protein
MLLYINFAKVIGGELRYECNRNTGPIVTKSVEELIRLSKVLGEFSDDLRFNIDALSTAKQNQFLMTFFHTPNTYIVTDKKDGE